MSVNSVTNFKKIKIWIYLERRNRHLSTVKKICQQKINPNTTNMSQLIFGGLLTTPVPTAPIVGITFIVLTAIVGIMFGPNYDGVNVPILKASNKL